MAEAPPRFSIPDEIVVRDLANEALLVHLGTGTYFGLDATGTRMWHLLAEHGSLDPVISQLLHEFEVEESQLRRDLDALIAQLLEKGLIVSAE